MPFRARHHDDPAVAPGSGELDRRLRVGSLVDIVVVDTRMSGRDEPAHTSGAPTLVPTDDRTLLSDAQRDWTYRHLADRHTTWKLLVNQVHIGAMQLIGAPGLTKRTGPVRPLINPDQWDGYPHERESLLAALRSDDVHGVLALSGDLHATFVRTVHDAGGPVLTELTTPAVTSPTFGTAVSARTKGLLRPAMLERILRTKNSGIEWVDTRHHGVSVLDITPEAIEITVHHLAEEGRAADSRRYRVDRTSPVPRRVDNVPG
jgi:alkaline phosphatase D